MSKTVTVISLALLLLIIVGGGIALYVVAQNMEPPNQSIEEVIPDDRFPQ